MKLHAIKISHFALLATACFSFIFFGCDTQPVEEKKEVRNNEYTVAAYIWPSCHHDSIYGDMLWPEGIGEWEVIKKGNPRFEGHYQPKAPLWGYEMDDDPEVMEKWINTATDYGVNTFIFDWYWFDGKPFLESSVNQFIKTKNNDNMQFYIMWANHSVKRNYWNVHKFKDDDSMLWDGAVNWGNYKIIVDRVINKYFKQSNYLKIDGKPIFTIYHLPNFLRGLESIGEAKKALEYFRAETKKAGFAGLHLQTIGNGAPRPEFIDQIEFLGFDSITKYNWGGPRRENYIQWGEEAMARRSQWDATLSVPFFANVSIGWDATPRFPKEGKEHVVNYHNSPQAFGAYLRKAKTYCDNHPDQPKIITINAWNEWVEGAYLLPDMKYGFSYLEAVKKVMKEDGSIKK
jgi:hypothetical protein